MKGARREVPGALVVRTWRFHTCDPDLIPVLRIKIRTSRQKKKRESEKEGREIKRKKGIRE